MMQARRRIPTGTWQRVVGGLLIAFGIFAALAATPFNGAGGVASACFGLGGPLLFWGLMLLYFSTIDTKVSLTLDRLPVGDAREGELH